PGSGAELVRANTRHARCTRRRRRGLSRRVALPLVPAAATRSPPGPRFDTASRAGTDRPEPDQPDPGDLRADGARPSVSANPPDGAPEGSIPALTVIPKCSQYPYANETRAGMTKGTSQRVARRLGLIASAIALHAAVAHAESGYDLWLRYVAID